MKEPFSWRIHPVMQRSERRPIEGAAEAEAVRGPG